MFSLSTRALRLALAAALLVGPATAASAEESSDILLRLERVTHGRPFHPGAFARVALDEEETLLRVRAWRLAPEAAYELRVDDVAFASFVSDSRGRASVAVDLRSVPLDPRGRLLSVADAQGDVLAGVVSGPMEPPFVHVREVTELDPQPAAGDGRALVRFHKSLFGSQRLVVRTLDAAPGLYEVRLDGEPLGHLMTGGDGMGRADFLGTPLRSRGHGWKHHRSRRHGHHPRLQPLEADPRYRSLELVRDGVVHFAGPVKAQIAGLEPEPEPEPEPPPTCTPGLTELRMAGSGDAALRVGFDDACRQILQIEVAFVSAGDYTVALNGAPLGVLTVDSFMGAVTFSSDPTGDELPLGGPLLSGDLVEVLFGGAVRFSATLP